MKFMHNTPPWVDSIRANFDFIAKKLLPSSSADDNGKVLTVVDGEWAAAPASGGLPTPTAEDVGKTMVVTENTVKGDVIVPEQSVTLSEDDYPPLVNTNIELFVEGAAVIATINGTDYSGVVIDDGGLWVTLGDSYSIYLDDRDNQLYFDADYDTYTVSLNATASDYEWSPVAIDEFPEYDIVISKSGGSYNILKGSYSDTYTKTISDVSIFGILMSGGIIYNLAELNYSAQNSQFILGFVGISGWNDSMQSDPNTPRFSHIVLVLNENNEVEESAG